jgi:RNA polymerase sigma factor (sigma-70 family)
VLQDTFLEVLRGLPSFRGEASLATWIRRIAVSRSLMVLRSAWLRRATLFRDLAGEDSGAWDPPDPVKEDAGLSTDLERALARLPDLSRIVVMLHDVEGYTHAEIAALMGRTPSFSKSQLARAHARLRGFLGQGGALPARAGTHGD